ncbi:DNA polymerase alpha/epsilon subunit B-domain-containing protein [Mycena rosella]|uniref:DNA polymerase alpha/epsilon subunit B-domain-containing protein n=1 Tax=Mycena rosella TaxID=1033263 RepID=A0AAD7GJS7_MYCRO|nr:DNA polymerase alpha/epsilon subunit B-domain-containing protein [Mycena rosella]
MAPVAPLATNSAVLTRPSTTVLPSTDDSATPSFLITVDNKSYKHQYANIYFVRLRILRGIVEEKARQRWHDIKGNPILVPKVLEVEKSQLCYIVGTVYMDMPLKPNVMEDIARDNSIPPPPPLSKFYSPDDSIMLEDESGRIQLVGARVTDAKLVTGVIIAALGMETPTGEFEVVDICYAEMAPQPRSNVEEEKMEVDADPQADGWIAVVSGLDIGSPSAADAQTQMLVEYLTGEEGGPGQQISASQISRLIIAGDSLAPVVLTSTKGEGFDEKEGRKGRRYGYDATSFSPHPTLSLSAHLLDIARTMPIHLLPGETDPSGVILPQQPFPRAMFGTVSSFGSFSCETNPTYLRIASASENSEITRTLLVNSGQPLNDMFKYLASPPNTPLSLLESTLRWRHMAPTAPDTLWCHPYFKADPFLISQTPDLYIVGGQRRFGTKMVVESHKDGKAQQRCRVVLVPRFADTGMLVLVNLRTLDVKCVKFGIKGMSGGSADGVQVQVKPDPDAAQ